MRRVLLTLVTVCLLCDSAFAATVRFEAVKLDEPTMAPSQGDLFQIKYTVDDVAFPPNREIDLKFDAAAYAILQDAVAPVNFDVLWLQPNNPPGAPGDLSIVTLFAFPDDALEFSVIVRMAGSRRPGSQEYFINQLDENGVILSRISSGQTIEASVPEPATAPAILAAVLALCSAAAVRRVRKSSAV